MPLLLSNSVLAEESTAQKAKKEKEAMEVIEIKSFKDSISSSLNNKRGANSIVDAISADDIGNFPDSNVAESLQRLPGVSITRSLDGSGEGVSIRGFAPGKNLTLINGQQWTSSAFNLENALSRGSNFGMLPSTIVSRSEVYKSSEARLPDGGVGGTVNIVTHKPLSQNDDFFAKVSAKAQYNTVSEDTAPIFSGIASWKLNDKFGALVSVDYSDIQTRREAVEVLRYDIKSFTPIDGERLENVYVPGAIGSANFNQTRERKTAMASFQYSPTDSIDMNLNYLTSEMSGNNLNTNLISTNHAGFINGYYNRGEVLSATVDPSLNLSAGVDEDGNPKLFDTVSHISYPDLNAAAAHRAGQSSAIYREAELTSDSLQFDASWTGDSLTLKASAGYSESSGGPGDIRSLIVFVPGRSNVSIDDGVGYVEYLDVPANELGRSAGKVWAHGRSVITSDNENNYFALDSEYFIDDQFITSIEFGVKQTNAEQQSFFESFSNDFHKDVTDEAGNLVRASYRGRDPEEVGVPLSTPDGFLDGISNNAVNKYYYLHPNYLEDITYTPTMHANRLGRSWKVEETLNAAFVQANFEHEFNGFVLRGNAGLRYSEQETTTHNFYVSALAEEVVEDIPKLTEEDVENFNFNYIRTGKTDELLPSLNVIFDMDNDWVFRAAYSTVISRPAFGQLAQQLSISIPDEDADGNVSRNGRRGNHELESFKSDKYDFSAEWYYKEASSVSLALFFYDIATFVSSEVQTEQFFGFDYEITKPVNVDGGTIKGLEFALSHSFDELPAPFDGLGTLFNYTYIDSESEDIHPTTEVSLPLAGLSNNTYNLTLFYSKEQWDARISYNYRDAYFETPVSSWARYNDEIGRLTAKVKYKFTDKLSMFVQGTNLTNQKNKRYADIPERPWQTSLVGSNYTLGIDYQF